MDILRQFGKLLRERRKSRDLTQEDVAHAANISVVYLSRLEAGDANPSLEVIVALSIALDIHPADLFTSVRIQGLTPVKK
jgi:transcriptional regulator with XRE-family HTH domain